MKQSTDASMSSLLEGSSCHVIFPLSFGSWQIISLSYSDLIDEKEAKNVVIMGGFQFITSKHPS